MKMINFDLEKIFLFKKATPQDIVEGNIVYLVGDGDEMHRKKIIEVLRPNDPWKAFCADDGCRYGLHELYVLEKISGSLPELEDIELTQVRGSDYCQYSVIENKLATLYENQEKLLQAIKLLEKIT